MLAALPEKEEMNSRVITENNRAGGRSSMEPNYLGQQMKAFQEVGVY